VLYASGRLLDKEYINTVRLVRLKGSDQMAVINVTPLTDITALIASESVNEGDVLLLEEGIYFQSVIIPKNNIRIIAKGSKVIFDGKSTLITAFLLSNVTGVLIDGINIRYYRANGIEIDSGYGNRIIKNTINNTFNFGISILDSSNNLLWKNEVSKCNDGIRLSAASTNNWIIENTAKECSDDGFESISAANNNAYISNKAIRNRFAGFEIVGSNNLLFENSSIDNVQGIIIGSGSDTMIIGNTIIGSRTDALTITGQRNNFTAENYIECTRQAGIFHLGQFGTFLSNEISYSGNDGILLGSSVRDLVMDNKLTCNLPENINDDGRDNVLINNIEKQCEPCGSPSDICGDNCDVKENSSN